MTPEEFIAAAQELAASYRMLEPRARELLREYTNDYRAAGLSTAWDDVPTNTDDMTWDPSEPLIDPGSLYFYGTDSDRDLLQTTVPAAYIRDPQNYIQALSIKRKAEAEARQRDDDAAEAAARPARIKALKDQLRQLQEQDS